MKLSNDVLVALSVAETDGPYLQIKTQLDRKLYLKVNEALEACGGKWLRKAKAHIFDGDARERLEVILVSGEVTTARELGFFPTPPEIAAQLAELAAIEQGHVVLEPSAGTGNLVSACLARGAGVYCIERDARRRAQLADRFASVEPVIVDREHDDFLDYHPVEPFDRVVMNPPFGAVGRGDHLDHVRHAFALLAPGGVLVTVLPAGVDFRQDRRHAEFREWTRPWRDFADALPDDAFKESGTSVRTVVWRLVAP